MALDDARRSPLFALALVVMAALVFRLVLLAGFIDTPGINDPVHYSNLGARLLAGQGFTIDYVWQYNLLHEDIVHPIDHWMPLSGVVAALGMALGGVNPPAAALGFALLGALVPVLAYVGARQLDLPPPVALLAAAFAITLPELVLNSLRTDTTIPNMLLVGGAILALVHALRHDRLWAYALAGLLAGLAYLNRNDALLLLPMLVLVGIIYALAARRGLTPPVHWLKLLAVPLIALLVVAPWLARNASALGALGSSETSRMFFMTSHDDHYAFDREISLETMLATQTPAEMLGKRAFELAAALYQMVTALDVFLPVAVAGGFALLVAWRDRPRLLALAPLLILLLGILIAYPLLLPYKSQAGSFKKAYLTLVPLLLPVAAYAIHVAVPRRAWQVGIVALSVAFMGLNAIYLVRDDAAKATTYHAFLARLADEIRALPDVNGDGQLRAMVEDPYGLAYHGVPAIMAPTEDLETTLRAAAHYGADYVMLPAHRPALDAFYGSAASDPRLTLAASFPRGDRTIELWAILPESETAP